MVLAAGPAQRRSGGYCGCLAPWRRVFLKARGSRRTLFRGGVCDRACLAKVRWSLRPDLPARPCPFFASTRLCAFASDTASTNRQQPAETPSPATNKQHHSQHLKQPAAFYRDQLPSRSSELATAAWGGLSGGLTEAAAATAAEPSQGKQWHLWHLGHLVCRGSE